MNILGFILIITAHFLAGRGLLGIFNIRQKPLVLFLLSVITGIALMSQVPFLLQLFHIPITTASVGGGILVLVLGLNLAQVRRYDYSVLKFSLPKKLPPLYDIIFMVTLVALMLPAIWLCFFFPPYARDMLSGPEPLAAYAIREHTLINSVFSVNLESTNNQIKPPYIVGLQIIYKMFVHSFGQLWVVITALCFIAWIFILLREKLHPLIVGALMLFFICTPDLYAYTYVMLFDYSNMVLFFAGVYFLAQYIQHGKNNEFAFAAILFGLATAVRSETLILVGILGLLPFFYFLKKKVKPAQIAARMLLLYGVSFIVYFLWINIFLKYYVPGGFNLSGQINHNLANISVFFQRLSEMNKMVFVGRGIEIYGWVTHLFLAVLLADVIFYRRFNTEAKIMLYSIVTVYFGLAFIGYLIPWVDLGNTTKRGLFKYIPLMMMYMRNSSSLLALSARIRQFEWPQAKEIKAPVAVPQQQKAAGKKKKK